VIVLLAVFFGELASLGVGAQEAFQLMIVVGNTC